MMGGNIWAESEAGVGSTFLFTAWFGVGAAARAGKRFVPDLAGIRALVVDDNAQAREILSDCAARLCAARRRGGFRRGRDPGARRLPMRRTHISWC